MPAPHDVSSRAPLIPMSLADLRQIADTQKMWLWDGYLAAGNVTLLTSQWKTGKTTLVSVLLHNMKSGGDIGGRAVCPGKAIVMSEESPAMWLERSARFDYADHVFWLCRPFRGKPTASEWRQTIDDLRHLREQHLLDLLVVDPLASFLPCASENEATGMLEVLTPLQQLTDIGVAILLLHHPRKQRNIAGAAARGSGALPGFVDITMEMRAFRRSNDADRRRQLLAWSRHNETPRRLIMELSADGAAYRVAKCIAPATGRQDDSKMIVQQIFADAVDKLTRRQILGQWPKNHPRPGRMTLYRWLSTAVEKGRIRRTGAGKKKCPYRYWTPEREKEWRQDAEHAKRLDEEAAFDVLMAGVTGPRARKLAEYDGNTPS